MPTEIVCKRDTEELKAGKVYDLLDISRDAYRIVVGKVAAWYRKDLFYNAG